MKKIISSLLLILPLLASAQNNEGSIIYNETRQLKFNFKGNPQMEKFKDSMPKERKSQRKLTFNSTESLYENYENLNEETADGGSFTTASGARVRIGRRRGSNTIVYRDVEGKNTIESRDFMSKKFLIVGEEAPVWKIKPEQIKIKGYVCQRAEWQKDSITNVVAYFTPQIPVASGPAEYVGLPGLVLVVDVNEGEIVIEASEFTFEAVADNTIEKPTKGKEVTREEFRAIMKAKMEERREMNGGHGGGGGRMIIIKE